MATAPDRQPSLGTSQAPTTPQDDRQRVKVTCRQAPHSILALGVAVELMFRCKPFSDFKFGPMVSVIRGEILRGHYLIAYRGNLPVGYIGWAECSQEIAERWMREGYSLSYDECKSGDCCVLITVVSSATDTTAALIRASRQRYPNRRIYFKREYPGGKKRKSCVFNRIEGDEPAMTTAPPAATKPKKG
jgi:hemolysin-activating ACP:hemolysin acyltransferase